MRIVPLALSSLAVFALQEAQHQASASLPPEAIALPDVEAANPETLATEAIPTGWVDAAMAPPEALAMPERASKADKPVPTSAHVAVLEAEKSGSPGPVAAAVGFAEIDAGAIAVATAPSSTSEELPSQGDVDRRISQADPETDVYVRPAAAIISYGEPIPIAENDPLSEFPIGSYHITSDQTLRRERVEVPEQTPDEYISEVRSCLASYPDLFRLRDMDGQRMLVPVLFNGQRGTLVSDVDGQPVCPSMRSRTSRTAPSGVEIPVPQPASSSLEPDTAPLVF